MYQIGVCLVWLVKNLGFRGFWSFIISLCIYVHTCWCLCLDTQICLCLKSTRIVTKYVSLCKIGLLAIDLDMYPSRKQGAWRHWCIYKCLMLCGKDFLLKQDVTQDRKQSTKYNWEKILEGFQMLLIAFVGKSELSPHFMNEKQSIKMLVHFPWLFN